MAAFVEPFGRHSAPFGTARTKQQAALAIWPTGGAAERHKGGGVGGQTTRRTRGGARGSSGLIAARPPAQSAAASKVWRPRIAPPRRSLGAPGRFTWWLRGKRGVGLRHGRSASLLAMLARRGLHVAGARLNLLADTKIGLTAGKPLPRPHHRVGGTGRGGQTKQRDSNQGGAIIGVPSTLPGSESSAAA